MEYRIGDIVRIVKDSGEGVSSTVNKSGYVVYIGDMISVRLVFGDRRRERYSYYLPSLQLELDPERLALVHQHMEEIVDSDHVLQ